MKPADILRRIAPVGTMGAHERVCADLLDECERDLAAICDTDFARKQFEYLQCGIGTATKLGVVLIGVKNTLVKLRGEA